MNFSEPELQNLCENYHNQGRAQGRSEAKEEMGHTLDLIIDSLHHGQPYIIPCWKDDFYKGMGALVEPIQYETPQTIQFTSEQLAAIRLLLCGPRS